MHYLSGNEGYALLVEQTLSLDKDDLSGGTKCKKKLSDDVEKLEASLTGNDECVVDIYELEEKHDDRISALEEEVSGLKGENVEMRSHFNAMIKQLNDLTAFVNEKHGHRIIEETLELDTDTPLLIRCCLDAMGVKGLFAYVGCMFRVKKLIKVFELLVTCLIL